MSIEAYIPGDPRLSINEQVAKICLDEIRDALKQEGIQDDSYLIIMTAIAIYREKKEHGIPDYDCIQLIGKGKGERQILNYKRVSDEHFAFLYSETINELGLERGLDFKEASKLWAQWAEEGLKILYCNYFKRYYKKHDIGQFLDKISKAITE